MINTNLLLLHVFCIIHIFVWLYVYIGGFISEKQNDFILYIGLPVIFIVQLFPFHILNEVKYMLADNTKNNTDNTINADYKDINNLSIDDKFNLCIESSYKGNDPETKHKLRDVLNLYKIPKYMEDLRYLFKNSFTNPFAAPGLLIIGFIINVYLHKFKYHH